MSLARAMDATTRSPLRRVVLLAAILSAFVLCTVCADATGPNVADPPSSTATATATAATPADGAPCVPHDTGTDHPARAGSPAPTMESPSFATPSVAPYPGDARDLVSAVPADRLPVVETGRLLADLCVWRK